MSSETSTDSLQPWQLFTLAGLIGATVVVFVSRGQTPAGVVLLSLTIFAAAVVGLAAWRTFAPFSRRDEPAGPQMIGGRTRAALDREKTLVLRSIKELEFDQAMGKVSDRDFADMSARLRVRAAGLMRQLDAGGGYREQIEKEIARRVGRTSSGSPGAPDNARPTTLDCSSCSTANDPDARFCKHCGASLGKTA
jgi:zinc ribbon protein